MFKYVYVEIELIYGGFDVIWWIFYLFIFLMIFICIYLVYCNLYRNFNEL